MLENEALNPSDTDHNCERIGRDYIKLFSEHSGCLNSLIAVLQPWQRGNKICKLLSYTHRLDNIKIVVLKFVFRWT